VATACSTSGSAVLEIRPFVFLTDFNFREPDRYTDPVGDLGISVASWPIRSGS